MILKIFLQSKKRDYQVVAVRSLTKSENLSTATGTCRPRLPVPIYIMIVFGFKFYVIHRLKHHQNWPNLDADYIIRIMLLSGSQTVCRCTLVCCEKFPGVPRCFLNFWKIC